MSGVGRRTRHCARTAIVAAALVTCATTALARGVRYPGCIAEALTQSAPINNDGTFTIRNVPADGSTRFQMLVTCPSPVRNAGRRARSGFLTVANGQTITVPPLTFVEFAPEPEAVALQAPRTDLTQPGEHVCTTLIGTFPGGEQRNLTHPMNGTTFRTTNGNVVAVDNIGCVTAIGRGVAVVTALNQGRTATLRFLVRGDRGVDTDGDGMTDACETARGLDPRSPYDAEDDPDGDGLTNRDECFYGADPFSADGDRDGLTDPEEVARGTDPSNADTDGDGLSDGDEVTLTTDPLDPNTDGDCLDDGVEVRIGLDPKNGNDGGMDKDGDGLTGCDEARLGTDPGDPDTDADGLSDGEESTAGADGFVTDPLESDTDLDGLNDGAEIALGTNPLDPTTASQDIVVDNRTVTITGRVAVRSLALRNGAVMTHPGATTRKTARLELVVDSLTVDATSRIDVTGRGFLGANQGGAGAFGRTLDNADGSQRRVGGSYGGLGGIGDYDTGRNPTYGDFRNPNEPGSGGGSDCGGGGNGGGVVRIQATTVRVDGQISADGQDGQGACGAGGSGGAIRVDTATLQGTGSIHADGGPGDDQNDNGGGGGGGRVALRFATNAGFDLTHVHAFGGMGRINASRGGVGTVYLRSGAASVAGELRLDAGALPPSARTPLYSLGATNVSTALEPNALHDATAHFVPGTLAGLRLKPNPSHSRTFTIVANDDTTLFTDPADGALTVVAAVGQIYSAQLPVLDRIVLARGALAEIYDGDDNRSDRRGRLTVGALDVLTGAALSHPVATLAQRYGVELAVAGTLTVDADSAIDATGEGFLGGNQGGNGTAGRTDGNVAGSQRRVGGSHGGLGGIGDYEPTAGDVYGDVRDPNELGGGGGADCGGGGNGGGMVRITAANLQLNGSILVNGQDGQGACGGGGAGGSLKLTVGGLHGTGFLRANGGPGDDQLDNGGGGGGGRVAVEYTDASQFDFAHVEALGGVGRQTGGIGTVYLKPAGARGTLVVRGSGRETPLPDDYAGDDLALDGALVSAQSLQPHTLALLNGAVLRQPQTSASTVTRLTIAATAVSIDATSKIDVSGRGFLGGNQGGASSSGRTLGNVAGSGRRAGGSHAGLGGFGDFDRSPNPSYGDVRDPNDPGSGGGADCGGGGNGGGVVRLTASTLTLDGAVLADGQDGQGNCGGGGAGGSVLLDVGTFQGSGQVRADGGDGDDQLDNGGGGGGGRIAVRASASPAFDLTHLEARGGAGTGRGGVGSVFVRVGGPQVAGELRLDGRAVVPSRVTPLYSLQGAVSTGLTANTLTDTAASFIPGTLVGAELNPNAGQNATFTVIANDATTLFTDPADGAMTAVAASGQSYAARPTFDRVVVRDQAQVELLDGDTNRSDRRGRLTATTFDVIGTATLTHPVATLVSQFGLDLNVSGTLTVDATSTIDVQAKGFLGGNLNGNGTAGRTVGNVAGSGRRLGGSFGGLGGVGNFDPTPSEVYGDVRAPDDPGSGGGADCGGGGSGGGLVHLTVGTLSLDGTINAGGQDGQGNCGGGGSGGTINGHVGSIAGTGFLRANGGPGDDQLDDGGGGGGGRIALYYTSAGQFDLTHLEVLGGIGRQTGGIGTVFTQQNGQRGALVVRGTGRETPLPEGYDTDDLTLDGALVSAQSLQPHVLTLANGAVLRQPPSSTTAATRLDITAATVTIDATSRIDVTGRGLLGGNLGGNGTAGRTLGNIAGSGRRAGGSYGGAGGFGDFDGNPNTVYGDFRNPDQQGSGGGSDCGGGGSGGGLVRVVADQLTLDGQIVADGQDGQGNCGGGGSGGGVKIDVDTLQGSGSVRANGGDGDDQFDNGGGGGGGRIAVDYLTDGGFDLTQLATRGGAGNGRGGPGTIFVRHGDASVAGVLRVDSLGVAPSRETPLHSLQGANSTAVAANSLSDAAATFVPGTLIGLALNPNTAQDATFTVIANDATTLFTDPAQGDLRAVASAGQPYTAVSTVDQLIVTDLARVTILDGDTARDDRRGTLIAGRVDLTDGAVVTHPPATLSSWFGLNLQVGGPLVVDATSAIDVSDRGFLGANQSGNGASGRTLANATGSGRRVGGSYGGVGGIGTFDNNPNATYGTAADPDDPGSGGGSDSGIGGSGGGLVRIVAGSAQLDGQIAASGQNGTSAGGGGSGGGIRLDVGTLSGTGSIAANGGAGVVSNAGGGGGGRVAVYATDASGFTLGNATATGGTGRVGGNGTAGTVFTQIGP